MFDSLFKVRFSVVVFMAIGAGIYLLYPSLSVFSFFALMITLHQIMLLVNSFNYCIPIRYLFGFFLCLQLLLGPTLAFNGLDEYVYQVYKMKVSESAYFSFTIPAVLCFIFGLHLYSGNLKGEVLNQVAIGESLAKRPHLPKVLIISGFISSFLSEIVSSELAFVFYLVSGFKFVGVFMAIINGQKLHWGFILLVMGSAVVSSLRMGMFHDLVTWCVMLAAVFAVKFRLKQWVKLTGIIAFVIFAFLLQVSKGDYRAATWKGGEEAGFNTFAEALEKSSSGGTLFDKKNLAQHNIRINQGFIITNIMQTVPGRIPFENGKQLQLILESAFLPRVLAPNKLDAGDQTIFMKYTGMQLARGTSMALSPLGDGYVNFGATGGCVFMFLLGLFFNQILKFFDQKSRRFPMLLLFVPLVFIYPIRPDCELQTSLGHLVKGSFLVFSVMLIWKTHFGLQRRKLANRFSFR